MRVKRGFKARRRRGKILELAKGFRGLRSKAFTIAKETVDRALVYAYRDRKVRKRDFRSLWIVRINAALNEKGISYSRFINGLKKSSIDLNRKMLSEMAIHDPASFNTLVETSKKAVGIA